MKLSDDELVLLNRELRTYALQLLKYFGWPKLAEEDGDLALQVLVDFMERPSMYNPAKMTGLKTFLKRKLLNLLINTVKTASNRNRIAGEIARMLPSYGFIDDRIDYDLLVENIKQGLGVDPIAFKIFDAVVTLELEKRDICQRYDYDEMKYYNGIRRIRTVMSNLKPSLKK